MAGPETPIRVVIPAVGAARSPELEAEARRLRQAARERWEACVRLVPEARAFLRRIEEELLPEMDAKMAEADRQLQATRAAYFYQRVREQGGQVMGVRHGPDVLPAMFYEAGELESDPAIFAATHHLRTLTRGRDRLLAWRERAVATIAAAEHQEPPS